MALYIENETESSQPNKRPNGLGIPIRLVRWVRDYGYADDDALLWLKNAARNSAPITHPEGNRRFDSLLLTIEDNKLIDLAVYEPTCIECGDTGRFIAHDPDGTARSWPCPACQVDKRKNAKQTRRSH